jgi:hypothetical protein
MRVLRGGFDLAGPARNKRHAVATFPDVAFVAAKLRAGKVALRFQFFGARVRRAAVVGGENHQRVASDPGFIERGQQRAYTGVGLHHEIGVSAKAAFALPLRRGHNRRMRRTEREVKEKRLLSSGTRRRFSRGLRW